MPKLTLRKNDSHTETRHDYDVMQDGKRIGRIYSGAGTPTRPKWLYAINGWGSALADDLEDAKQKFKQQLERLGGKPPWPP